MKYFIHRAPFRLRSFLMKLRELSVIVAKAAKMQCPDSEKFEKVSDNYQTCKLPKRFAYPSWFHGYGTHRQPAEHPLYRTTSSEYGRFPPTVHTVPTCFYPCNQDFSKLLAKTGMYRNYSLNTGLDPQII